MPTKEGRRAFSGVCCWESYPRALSLRGLLVVDAGSMHRDEAIHRNSLPPSFFVHQPMRSSRDLEIGPPQRYSQVVSRSCTWYMPWNTPATAWEADSTLPQALIDSADLRIPLWLRELGINARNGCSGWTGAACVRREAEEQKPISSFWGEGLRNNGFWAGSGRT